MVLSPLDPVTAVVTVDLQVATTSQPGVQNIVEVVANAGRLVGAFRARGLPVVIASNNLNNPPLGRTSFASLTSAAAVRKTLELVAEEGPAQTDLDPLFAALEPDQAGVIDGVDDIDNMPRADEPAQVVGDLNDVSKSHE